MKSISHKAKLKFEVGEKVFYKHGNKVKSASIKRIDIITTVKKNNDPVTSIDYIIYAHYNSWSYYKANRAYKEDKLFSSKEAASKGMIPTEKTKIEKMIKNIKKKIVGNKQSIKRANDKLAEIKKEELIEKLAGI